MIMLQGLVMTDRPAAGRGGLSSCVTGVLLGSMGTLALLLAVVPSLRDSLADLSSRSCCRRDDDDGGDATSDEDRRHNRRPADRSVRDAGDANEGDGRTSPKDPHGDPSCGDVRPNGEVGATLMDSVDLPLRLLSKAEGVVQYRSTLLVVIERCVNDFNYSAILRTAEALGVQDVWLVDPPPPAAAERRNAGGDGDGDGDEADVDDDASPSLRVSPSPRKPIPRQGRRRTEQEQEQRNAHHLFAQNATNWLSLREFATSAECLRELKKCGYQVWATDLSQEAVPLVRGCVPPDLLSHEGKVAIVLGTEAVGVSQEVLDQSDLRVYLPLRGFADSLNLSVAAALVIHQVLLLYPELIGNYPHKDELRQRWFAKLASQRMMTPRQKKDHRKLQSQIADCQSYLHQQKQGTELSREQRVKLDRLPDWEGQMREVERAVVQAARAAVDEHVRNPPPPLTDLRRANEHRVTFVGKNTKQRHQDHWAGMVATTNYRTPYMSSARAFRDHQGLANPNEEE